VDSLALALLYPERAKPEEVPRYEDMRMFSAGGGTDILEWDLVSGNVKVRESMPRSSAQS
jgi:U3 small nucleolar RNA-associated protein 4